MLVINSVNYIMVIPGGTTDLKYKPLKTKWIFEGFFFSALIYAQTLSESLAVIGLIKYIYVFKINTFFIFLERQTQII